MEPFYYGIFFALGAVCASFAGVVAGRLHTGESWISGRSRCDSCGRYLGPPDLVPILSWLLSLGRCRTCGSRVPAAYPAFEAALGLVFVLGYHSLGLTLPLAPFLAAAFVLAVIVLYDLRHTVVPPAASALLAALCVLFAWLAAPHSAAFGGALVAGSVIGLGFLAMHAVTRGKAMGLGDAPVAFSLAVLASPYAFPGLLFSFWSGAVIGIAVLFLRRGGPRMGVEVPFVPFLALGFLLAYFIQWNPLALAL
jgi:prepilin signal peptidase PulO-like enzyme (type II secretory pathway)